MSSSSRRKRPRPPPPTAVVVYEHADCDDHQTYNEKQGEHQEGPARLSAIRERLERLPGIAFTSEFALASHEQLCRVHSETYLN